MLTAKITDKKIAKIALSYFLLERVLILKVL